MTFLSLDFQANPLKLLARTERLQDELPLLREECDKILAAKQVRTAAPEYSSVYVLLCCIRYSLKQQHSVVLSEVPGMFSCLRVICVTAVIIVDNMALSFVNGH